MAGAGRPGPGPGPDLGRRPGFVAVGERQDDGRYGVSDDGRRGQAGAVGRPGPKPDRPAQIR